MDTDSKEEDVVQMVEPTVEQLGHIGLINAA
jgi:hypothetical protein